MNASPTSFVAAFSLLSRRLPQWRVLCDNLSTSSPWSDTFPRMSQKSKSQLTLNRYYFLSTHRLTYLIEPAVRLWPIESYLPDYGQRWSQIRHAQETARKAHFQDCSSSRERIQDHTCFRKHRRSSSKSVLSMRGCEHRWDCILHHGVLGRKDYRRSNPSRCYSSREDGNVRNTTFSAEATC